MRGTVYMLCGLPGSGKTTLAKQLEKEKHALRFCPDEWIWSLIPEASRVREQDKLRAPIEKIQLELALTLTQRGLCVVLENGFWGRKEREEYMKKIKTSGARVEFHYLDSSHDKIWNRLKKRNKNLPFGTYEISLENLKKWEELFEKPTPDETEDYDLFEYHVS